jgi:23S rRNA pseudouridine955/2504/2580 synthase/23S rRNA pseudouridine1911/1915/1917 synthase
MISHEEKHMPRQKLDLSILYEDDDLLVIDKPAGLLVIPDRWDASKPTVVKLARAYLHTHAAATGALAAEPPRIWVVHRLDRDTSGALILAKSARVHAVLSQQFEHGQVLKTYVALVSGQGIRAEGVIRLPIGPHPHRPGMMAIQRRHGKSALTRYAVVERFRGYTLLDVRPHTGRSHQIRVHLQAIGHSLAIDPLYGSDEPLWLSAFKPSYRPKAGAQEHPLMARLTLHAQALELTHPTYGETRRWVAPLPKDFAAVLRNLRRYRRLPGEQPAPPRAARGEEKGLEC